jgi:hypothetical protein
MDPPSSLPPGFEKRAQKREQGKDAAEDRGPLLYPIPRHESQWFLFDCMRYVSPREADTRVLRSLMKGYWSRRSPS